MKLYNENNIKEIANSIREKNGKSEEYKLREMPNAIRELPSMEEYQDLIENSFTNNFEGSEGFIEDTAKARVIDMKVKGDIKQDSYEGYNILNPETRNTRSNGVTISYDNETQIITLNGTCTANNTTFKFINEEDINEKVLPANTTGYLLIKYISGSSTGLLNVVAYDSAFSQNILARAENGVTQDILATSKASIEKRFIKYRIRMDEGSSFDNLKIKVMLSFDKSEYEPYVGGTSSPNINYPQAVKVVDGNYDVVVGNKNLLLYPYYQTTKTSSGVTFTDNGDGTITVNGTATADLNFYLRNMSNKQKFSKGTFTFSSRNKNGANNTHKIQYIAVTKDGTSTPINTYGDTAITKTFNDDWEMYASLRVYKDVTVNNVTFYPQIEPGSTATPYVLHEEKIYSLDMCNRNKIQPVNYDKGLTNGVDWSMKGNSITAKGTAIGSSQSILGTMGDDFSFKLPKGTYTLSGGTSTLWVQFFKKVGDSYELLTTSKGTPITFTFENEELVYYRGSTPSSSAVMDETIYVMLNKGTEPLAPAPYTEPYQYTAYKDAYFRRKGYKDFELVNEWDIDYMTRNHENCWRNAGSNNDNVIYTNLSNTSMMDYLSDRETFYCNMFKFKGQTGGWSTALQRGVGMYSLIQNNHKYIYFVVPKTIASTDSEWLKFLDEHNLYVVYKTQTPTITPITNEILNSQLEEISKTKMYEGGTNITITGEEALPILNPNYIVSKNYIQSAMLLAEPEIGG